MTAIRRIPPRTSQTSEDRHLSEAGKTTIEVLTIGKMKINWVVCCVGGFPQALFQILRQVRKVQKMWKRKPNIQKQQGKEGHRLLICQRLKQMRNIYLVAVDIGGISAIKFGVAMAPLGTRATEQRCILCTCERLPIPDAPPGL